MHSCGLVDVSHDFPIQGPQTPKVSANQGSMRTSIERTSSRLFTTKAGNAMSLRGYPKAIIHHLFASSPLHSYYLTPQRNQNPSRVTNAPQLAQSHKRLSQMQNVVQSIISSPYLTILLGVCVCAWGGFVVSCVIVRFAVLSIGCGVYTFSVISETEDAVPPTAMRVCR